MLPFLLYLLSVKFSSVKSNFGLDFLFAGFLKNFYFCIDKQLSVNKFGICIIAVALCMASRKEFTQIFPM